MIWFKLNKQFYLLSFWAYWCLLIADRKYFFPFWSDRLWTFVEAHSMKSFLRHLVLITTVQSAMPLMFGFRLESKYTKLNLLPFILDCSGLPIKTTRWSSKEINRQKCAKGLHQNNGENLSPLQKSLKFYLTKSNVICTINS